MCGEDTSKRIRVGALAVLNPPDGIPPSTTFRGELSLGPSNTRVRFAELLTEELETAQPITHLRVTIHQYGDLTKPASESGIFHQFEFTCNENKSESHILETPLLLQVGDEGVIGRRVSITACQADGEGEIVAEGIVGFNHSVDLSTMSESEGGTSLVFPPVSLL